ncbi:MAG: response regulator transcription factor [Clostridia bacterium]|nr:response regulator transcription factor [Clostridia bacterium]MDE6210404.1 response regulator transcription factor [Clostridia bacterium]MDE6605141.1 response regulator transcription factor [Clostridia bacterium]MDE6870315.1 response regulator transcription factor [Clostridia bacterium]MDE7208318.1 response regulator transcription factor [Clostridia bacterium]
MKFLVIDDDSRMNQSIVDTLGKLGSCDSAYDGVEGLYMAEAKSYDLVVTELILPKKSGFEIIRDLRKKSNCPILTVSAINSVEKRIEGLRLGADDYLSKPFNNEELLARAEAILRRYNNNFHSKYVNKDIELDYNNKMLRIKGVYVRLSGKIYDILECLIRSRNIIISKDQLFNKIWGLDSETVITVVEVYVSKLRKLLENHGCGGYLKTIKNLGYMWSDTKQPATEE